MDDVEIAHKCKDKGNNFFKKGKYEEALKQYTDAITAVDSQVLNPAEQLKTSCLLNMAVIFEITDDRNVANLIPLSGRQSEARAMG